MKTKTQTVEKYVRVININIIIIDLYIIIIYNICNIFLDKIDSNFNILYYID